MLRDLIFSLLILQIQANQTLLLQHSLLCPYNGKDMVSPQWEMWGDVKVDYNLVQLTLDQPRETGIFWNLAPCMTRQWESIWEIKNYGKEEYYFGLGMGIWYAKDRMVSGPLLGNKDDFEGFGVILTHEQNSKLERISLIKGIFLNNSLSTYIQIGRCEMEFRNLGRTAFVIIHYEKNKLTVSTDMSKEGVFKECFSVENFKLQLGFYFGITAKNSADYHDNHCLVEHKFFGIDVPEDLIKEQFRRGIPGLPLTLMFRHEKGFVWLLIVAIVLLIYASKVKARKREIQANH